MCWTRWSISGNHMTSCLPVMEVWVPELTSSSRQNNSLYHPEYTCFISSVLHLPCRIILLFSSSEWLFSCHECSSLLFTVNIPANERMNESPALQLRSATCLRMIHFLFQVKERYIWSWAAAGFLPSDDGKSPACSGWRHWRGTKWMNKGASDCEHGAAGPGTWSRPALISSQVKFSNSRISAGPPDAVVSILPNLSGHDDWAGAAFWLCHPQIDNDIHFWIVLKEDRNFWSY